MIKILIAEDDLMIADAAEELLVKAGYAVCGIARTVGAAVAIARNEKPDLIVVDLRLADDGLGIDIAARLAALDRCGILYATGNSGHVKLTDADGDACLSKPYRAADLLRSLELVSEIVATGTASLPFPRGFHLLPSAITLRAANAYG
jgi:DNA-binding response OmpR family regulator